MTIGVSIVHFVIKVPKLVQMIDIEYMLNKYPFSIQDGRQKFKMAATKFSFLTFPHQTAVISRASSRSSCFIYLLLLVFSRASVATSNTCYPEFLWTRFDAYAMKLKDVVSFSALGYIEDRKSMIGQSS